jgi:hypothetical protein
VHDCLARLGADFRFLDQRHAARSAASIRADGHRLLLEIEGPGQADRLDFDRVSAAYLRPVETDRALAAHLGEQATSELLRAENVDRAMIMWADLATALVVNPPAAMAVNNSKPYQLKQIAGYNFAVPDTLITTDPSAVRAFGRRYNDLIYKSISGVRSVVKVLGHTGLDRLEDVANAPTQFQEYVPGVDIRVHVVGDQTFATEIRSDADDYRYASLSGDDLALASVEIPEEVENQCRAMAAGMGLAVAGVDLRRTPDDRWVCFEVNPSPAFIFYEEATGQPIGNAIALLLARADEEYTTKKGWQSCLPRRTLGSAP